MRIGVDAREICGQATGVGRWLGMLLRQWTSTLEASGHELVLYAPAPIESVPGRDRLTEKVIPGGSGTAWEQFHLPRVANRDDLDVFFAPAYTAPLQLRVPFVALIHDVSFAAHPEWFTPREGIRRRLLTRRTAHAACAVITVSSFSRDEIVEWLDVPASRIHVILPGVELPSPHAAPMPREPRVLYVGSIFNRRRVPALIHAFAELAARHPGASLDIVGDNRTYPHQDIRQFVARANAGGRIRWHEYIADGALAELYRSAGAFAFLSEYEGLGMTPLEALANGVPPLLLDTRVARECCGDAALYVQPNDESSVETGLERLLFDEDLRGRLLSAAPGVLARYSWERAAREVMTVLEACGRR